LWLAARKSLYSLLEPNLGHSIGVRIQRVNDAIA